MAVSEVVGLSSLFEEDPNLNLFKLPTDTPEELLRLGWEIVSREPSHSRYEILLGILLNACSCNRFERLLDVLDVCQANYRMIRIWRSDRAVHTKQRFPLSGSCWCLLSWSPNTWRLRRSSVLFLLRRMESFRGILMLGRSSAMTKWPHGRTNGCPTCLWLVGNLLGNNRLLSV